MHRCTLVVVHWVLVYRGTFHSIYRLIIESVIMLPESDIQYYSL